MRVIVVGATGTIGTAVVAALGKRHNVVKVRHQEGGFHVDLAPSDSVSQLFRVLGPFDALVCTAGLAIFANLDELRDADYHTGLSNKLMGQVNLVRIGRQYISDGGSFTLTSGVLSQEPMQGSTSISMVNAGVEGFVRAAALELPRGIRVNAVSPPRIGNRTDVGGSGEMIVFRGTIEKNYLLSAPVDDPKRGQRCTEPTKRAGAQREGAGDNLAITPRLTEATLLGYNGRRTRAIIAETALFCRGNVNKQH